MQILTVLNVFSRVLAVFGLLLLLPMGISVWQGNPLDPFVNALAVTLGVAGVLFIVTHQFVREMRPRDGLLLAAMTWLVLPVFGALPLQFHIDSLTFTKGYFEAASGLTTTGATVLSNLDTLPEAINFWRCLLIWVGGMGIIVLSVAILPLLGVGGSQIVKAETPGPMKDSKLTPRITQTAKGLWLVYFIITLACGISYYLAGMSFFDAIIHSFSTMGLGGFSNHDASYAYWNSETIDSVAIVFMLLSGINFATHFQVMRSRSFSPYRWDPETRCFLFIVLSAGLLTTLYLWYMDVYGDFWVSLRYSLFNVISLATTTGFATTDYGSLWPIFIPITMLLMSHFATSSGSTGSGIKMIRAIVLLKQLKNELIRVVHPNAHVSLKLSGQVISPKIVFSILTFLFAYVLAIIIASMLLCASGLDIVTAISAVLACFSNTGPGLNEVGPVGNYGNLTNVQIWILSLMMLMGRLETFTLLAIVTPAFWRK